VDIKCIYCGGNLDTAGNCNNLPCQIKEQFTKPNIPPPDNNLPEDQNPRPYLHGWVCPRCGRGNSPYTQSCSCIQVHPNYNPFPYHPFIWQTTWHS